MIVDDELVVGLEAKIKSLESGVKLLRDKLAEKEKLVAHLHHELEAAHQVIGRTVCAGENLRRRGTVLT